MENLKAFREHCVCSFLHFHMFQSKLNLTVDDSDQNQNFTISSSLLIKIFNGLKKSTGYNQVLMGIFLN